jgi:hypothetical protein
LAFVIKFKNYFSTIEVKMDKVLLAFIFHLLYSSTFSFDSGVVWLPSMSSHKLCPLK